MIVLCGHAVNILLFTDCCKLSGYWGHVFGCGEVSDCGVKLHPGSEDRGAPRVAFS